tara:strand:- start:545 stop:1468 length:924 start_codon:yes stop_codon:yes gene_type:complete
MGTTYNIRISDSINSQKIKIVNSKIDSLLIHINSLFSTYIFDSEISKFNKTKNSLEISSEFILLFNLSKEVNRKTNGAFDPTIHPLVKLWGFGENNRIDSIPSNLEILNTKSVIGLEHIIIKNNQLLKLNPKIELDFNAIAKGYGVDAISKLLISENIFNFMVEIGGELFCNGKKNNENWKIGIQNPFINSKSNNVLRIIEINNKAMATSGSYRNFFEFNGQKYSHTINPKTGYPINHNLVSVSIIADNCTIADSYATAMMVLGYKRGLEIIEQDENLEAIFIVGDSENHKIIGSSGMTKIMNNLSD